MKRHYVIFILLVVLFLPSFPSVIANGVCKITVKTEPDEVNKFGSEVTKIFGYLERFGSGLDGETVELYYQYASTQYGSPSDGTWTYIGNDVTDGGDYKYDWDPDESLANGYYWIKAVYDGVVYCEAITGVECIPNLHVIPEVPFGPLMVLASMMLAFVVLKRKRHTIAESPNLI